MSDQAQNAYMSARQKSKKIDAQLNENLSQVPKKNIAA